MGSLIRYDRDSQAVKHLVDCDPILYEVVELVGPVSLPVETDPFRSLTFSIIGQQLSMKAADTISARAEQVLGQMSPQAILATPVELLRSAGLSRSKVDYLTDLSSKCITGEIELSALAGVEDEAVVESLIRVKGVGRWTAEMFLIFALGREDVFSWGDGGLRRALRALYGDMVDQPGKMEARVALWSPYRSIASLYLWKTLESGFDGP